MVAVDLLLGRRDVPRIDAVLCIVDASNLERNLYLVSQVLELGPPTVLAVNMLDVAENHGIKIDLARLEQQLGVPVTPIQANRRIGLARLKAALAGVTKRGERREERGHTPLPGAVRGGSRPVEPELADHAAVLPPLADPAAAIGRGRLLAIDALAR